MKIYIYTIICATIILSCKQKDLIIRTSVDKKDSILVLEIKNNTTKNFLVEIPALDHFWYKDEYDKLNPEYFSQSSTIDLMKSNEDSIKHSIYKCDSFFLKKHNIFPKFIDGGSTKKYYYKLVNYKKGRKILLMDDNFDTLLHNLNISENDKLKKKLIKLRTKTCGGYEYFTGNFEFIPKEIILP